MMFVSVEFGSRRLWVLDRRLHHGATGVALALAGLFLPNPWGPIALGVGVGLIADDWADRWWGPARRTSA